MLVLARKPGQKLILTGPDGQPITLTVLDVRGELVKIGIDASRSVSIYREEIYLEILEANQQALNSTHGPAAGERADTNTDSLKAALAQMTHASVVLPKKPEGMGITGIKHS